MRSQARRQGKVPQGVRLGPCQQYGLGDSRISQTNGQTPNDFNQDTQSKFR